MKTQPLGQPSHYDDLIITRRIAVLDQFDHFFDEEKTLIDIGCGNGATLFHLADRFRLCHGIDLSEENYRTFEQEAAARNIHNCTISIEDIGRLEIENRQYDRAICFEVLEHVEDDLQAAKNIYELLAANGKAVITVPNKWWIFEIHGAHLPLLPWNRVPFFSWLPTPIHERFAKARIYTQRRIITLLKKAGFEIIETHYITAPMDRVTWPPLQRLLRKMVFGKHTTNIPVFSTAIMVFVEKKVNP